MNSRTRAAYRLRHGIAPAMRQGAGAAAAGLIALLASFACSSDSGKTAPVIDEDVWQLDTLDDQQGISFDVPTFDVPQGHEEQSCYFVRAPDLNDGQDYWVDRVRMATTVGSHHLNVFRVRTIVDLKPEDGEATNIGPYAATVVRGHDDYKNNPCWGSANWADWPLVANTESPVGKGPYTDWQLPDGVGLRFTPGEMLMIQPHYVNTSVQPTPVHAHVGINFYRSLEANPVELGTLFATQQNIRICQGNPNPTFSGTCRFPNPVTITAANGHFHSRGKELSMFVWDGHSVDQPPLADSFYVSDSWNSPPMMTSLEREVPEGGGVWWNCEYQWREPIYGCDTVNAKDPQQQGDCCYTFGGNTDVGEHCNVFVYYYPKVDTDVFCN